MKKADYLTLANLIRDCLNNPNMSGVPRVAVIMLARKFAAGASVNKAEFLKACGIE